MKNKDRPVIIVDTREKKPWDFEADEAFGEVKYQKLDVGDYSIEGLEDILAVERKANFNELHMNFTSNAKRIKAEFDRMKDHKIKILVIEEDCADMFNPSKYYVNKLRARSKRPINPKAACAIVASNLTKLIASHGVMVIFGGTRSQSLIRGIMLEVYRLHKKGEL